MRYKRILENNRAWAAEMTQRDPNYFTEMAKGQSPDFLYIGCADSRVPANVVMGLGAGEVFVHRNIANVVSNTDLNVASVIEYAVVHLGVKEIIVAGHYGCGGVMAAMAPKDLGILNPWLRNIRDVYRLHEKELNAIADPAARTDRLVELNVQEQVLNVIKIAAVQKSYIERGYPKVHGLVFDIKTGLLKDLNLDFEAMLNHIQQIYRLTDKEFAAVQS
jgi:carbonic anhydrase